MPSESFTEVPKIALTLAEAAAAVGVSRSTLSRHIDEGRLRAKHTNVHGDKGKVLITIAALEQWLAELPDA